VSSLLWYCMHKHGVLKKLKVAMPPVNGNLVIAEEMLEGRMEWGSDEHKKMLANREIPAPPPSGIVGVTWSKSRACWVARVFFNNQTVTVGGYATIAEAAKARADYLANKSKSV
jgi:hypothetical protein